MFAARHASIRALTGARVLASWDALGSWRGDDVAQWAAQSAAVVEAGQVASAATEDAWLAALLSLDEGSTVRPLGVSRAVATGARGVPAAEVLERAGARVWRSLANGAPLEVAVAHGRARAELGVRTDLQLARTHAARDVLRRRDGVVGFRRVLSGGSSCALCVLASTQRYRRGDLLPVHPGCDCGVAPIKGAADPGRVLAPDTLDDLQSRIAERFGETDATGRRVADFRNLIATHEHGELGPILVRRGDTFTGPDDL
ncbi:MAG: hypothetical protein OEV62_00215 [Actinomycetota bacterium]|nr:hypothetical protein [Actinomycetota bacterium]